MLSLFAIPVLGGIGVLVFDSIALAEHRECVSKVVLPLVSASSIIFL